MPTVIRRSTAPPAVLAEARPKLADLAQTMRQLPGFVASSFLATEDGIATITITEEETGTEESIHRAADWVRANLTETRSLMSAPDVTRGEALIAATR
jgi:hypothetical protein